MTSNTFYRNPKTPSFPRSRRVRRLLAVLGCLALALTVPAGADQAPSETFGEETAVTVVEIPVQVVTRDGVPVRGLDARNFRVFDGRDEVPIDSFEVIDLTTVEASGPQAMKAVQPAARRHFLLLFDLSFTSPAQVVEAQRAARQLVASDVLHPSDLVGVAFYTSREGLTLPLGFTTDRRELRRVVDGFGLLLGEEADVAALGEGQADADRKDPLNLTAGAGGTVLSEIGAAAGLKISDAEQAALMAAGSVGGPGGGRNAGMGGGLLMEMLADIDASQRQSIKQERGSEVRAMLANYEALARQLASVEGKKYMVLFTGGFPSRLMGVGEFGMPESGASQTLSAMDAMTNIFRDSGWVIHTVEPRGARAQYWEESGAQSLTYLASETGGLSFQNDNDLGTALGEMVENTSVTYLLTFRARDVPMDGSLRPLRVRLEDVPRGTKAVHRSAYRAPGGEAEQGLSQRATTAAMLLADEGWESLPVVVRALPRTSRDGGLAPVPVIVEVPGAGLLGGEGDGPLAVEIYSYAFDAEGRIRGFLSQSIGLDRGAHGETLAGGGLKFFGALELPPGAYELRTLVRNPINNLSSLLVSPLDVEAVSDPTHATLLAPIFLQGDDERWILTRDGGEHDYPFILGDQQFVPAARPVLASDTVARLVVPGYGLGSGSFQLESRVTAASGQAVEGGEVDFVSRAGGENGAPEQILTTFRPTGLAPGNYALLLTLVDTESGSRETVSAPFQVKGP
jgi:VWFA-related protein